MTNFSSMMKRCSSIFWGKKILIFKPSASAFGQRQKVFHLLLLPQKVTFGPSLLPRHDKLDGFYGDKKIIALICCMWTFFRSQKLGVTQGFFVLKLLFDFVHFLEKWLQRHLVTLHWIKRFWCGINQYMLLASKIGSKSVKEFISRFCFVQIKFVQDPGALPIFFTLLGDWPLGHCTEAFHPRKNLTFIYYANLACLG